MNIKLVLARREFAALRDEFYEDMAAAIAAGSSIDEILRSAASRALDGGSSNLALLYSEWAERIGDIAIAGKFSDAIAEDVPQTDVMVLKGFEQAGRLPDGLYELSVLVKRGRKVRSAMLGAIAMPALSMTVVLLIGAFFGSEILPVLAQTVPVEKWSNLGQGTYFVTTTLHAYFFVILTLFIGLAKLFQWSLMNWDGELRRRLDQIGITPYNFYKNYQSATFLVVLSSLLKSGSSLDAALRLLSDTSGRWMSMYLSESVDLLGDHSMTDPAAAFNNGFLPNRILWRIQDSARRASFPEAVRSIADTAFDKIADGLILQAAVLNKASFMIAGGSLVTMVAGVLQVAMSMKDLAAQ